MPLAEERVAVSLLQRELAQAELAMVRETARPTSAGSRAKEAGSPVEGQGAGARRV